MNWGRREILDYDTELRTYSFHMLNEILGAGKKSTVKPHFVRELRLELLANRYALGEITKSEFILERERLLGALVDDIRVVPGYELDVRYVMGVWKRWSLARKATLEWRAGGGKIRRRKVWRACHVHDALLEYAVDHGKLPKRLEWLVPAYLPFVPRADDGRSFEDDYWWGTGEANLLGLHLKWETRKTAPAP